MDIIYASPTNPAVRVICSPDGAVEVRTLRNWLSYTEPLELPLCKRFGLDTSALDDNTALNLALELAYLSGKINTNEAL